MLLFYSRVNSPGMPGRLLFRGAGADRHKPPPDVTEHAPHGACHDHGFFPVVSLAGRASKREKWSGWDRAESTVRSPVLSRGCPVIVPGAAQIRPSPTLLQPIRTQQTPRQMHDLPRGRQLLAGL